MLAGMPATDRLARQLAFVLELDRLKTVLRRTLLTDRSRHENSAEHSWHIALMAVVLAEHADVDGVCYVGGDAGIRAVERASAGNMKRTWCEAEEARDWRDPRVGEGREFLRQATHVKNVWVPYGE